MYPSTFRQRLANNELLLSSSLFTREPHIASAVFQTGPDWVWIDQEHGPHGTESIGMICVMARQMGVAGIIRVPWNAPTDIKKPFDVGAVGIIVPQVDTPDEARDAVKFARFPPLGERSIAPWFAGPMGIDAAEVMKNNNDETALILQMESAEAYENIDDILKVEGYDVILVGPTDLSATLGIPGQIHHAKVENIMVDVAQKAKAAGKALATTYGDPEDCRRWIKEGYRMMNISSPLVLGTVQLKRIMEEFRAELG